VKLVAENESNFRLMRILPIIIKLEICGIIKIPQNSSMTVFPIPNEMGQMRYLQTLNRKALTLIYRQSI
jgi:hypothetical protein